MSDETYISDEAYDNFDQAELPKKIVIDDKGIRKVPGTITLESAIHAAKQLGRLLENKGNVPYLHFKAPNHNELSCIAQRFREVTDAIEEAFCSHIFIKRNPDLQLENTSRPVEKRHSAEAFTAMYNAIIPDNEPGQLLRELLKTAMEVLDMPTDRLVEPSQTLNASEDLKKKGKGWKNMKRSDDPAERT